MRCITNTNEVQHRLWQMSISIGKEVASWKEWSLVEIKPLAGDETTSHAAFASKIQNIVREVVSEKECTLLQLEIGWNYLMCKHWKPDDLSRLRDALEHNTTVMMPSYNIAAYDIPDSATTVIGLLADHITRIPRVVPDANSKHRQSSVQSIEMQSLHEVMEANIKQRKYRRPPHVLLVEDDPLTRRIVAHVLKYDYRLVTAHTAEEALTHYLIHAPDLVFLDINLPDGNGFNVMSRILEHDPQACIVMFSSDGQMETILDATHQGASGFIAKPFTKEQLLHYIKKAEHQKAASCA